MFVQRVSTVCICMHVCVCKREREVCERMNVMEELILDGKKESWRKRNEKL